MIKHKLIIYFSLFYLCLLVFFSIFYSEADFVNVTEYLQTPNVRHWFGTDSLGRDLFARIISAARVTILLGLVSGVIATLVGVLFAWLATAASRSIENILIRFLEIYMSLPSVITIGLVLLYANRTFTSIALAIAGGSWMIFAKVSHTLLSKELVLPYISASRVLGASQFQIFYKHLLPKVLPMLIVLFGIQLPHLLLYESTLSFLGVGLQPPQSSWGLLILEGWQLMSAYPHLLIGPSIILFLTIFSLNCIFEFCKEQLNLNVESEK